MTLCGMNLIKSFSYKKKSFSRRFAKSRKTRGKSKWSSGSLGRILPNAVTFAALCLGLTAIHFGFRQEWEQAVSCIFLAGVLDGVDGRLARFLKASSSFGANLDSLCDFTNFGVAPSFVIYFYALHQWGNKGWGLCLLFSACMAWRLARFNSQSHYYSHLFSVGVPAPAGAFLVLFPIVFHFVFGKALPLWSVGVVTFCCALMLASRYPTFVFKKIHVPRGYRGLLSLVFLIVLVTLVSAPWDALFFLSILYTCSLPVSGYFFYKKGYR